MRIPRAYRQHWDWVIVLCAALLIAAGFLTIYSATHVPDGSRHGYIWRFAIAFGLGLGTFAFSLFLPLRLWDDWAWLFYGGSLVLLAAVLFFGIEEYGARRWFPAGPLRLQPSEIGKLALIVALARYLSGKRVDLSRASSLGFAAALVFVPFVLVLKEPDLGTSGAYIGLAVPMLLWAGLPRIILLLAGSPLVTLALAGNWIPWALFVAVVAVVLWRSRLYWGIVLIFVVVHAGIFFGAPRLVEQLEPYQQRRIATFLDPGADPSGAGYQVLQSKIALGSGGIAGKGYLQGTQSGLAFLPQQHTDFIYSVLGEEWGFLGCATVLVLFLVLILRAVHVALHSRGAFGSLLAIGIAGLLFYHAALNMAMTMGLFPVTGLPLPFVSYGGSFLLTMMAAVGLLQNVAVHRYDY